MTTTGGVEFPGGTRADGLPAVLSDPRRLAAVEATGLLGTGPEQAFDDLANLAAAVTGCRRAFITLVDDARSFWKSCVGSQISGPADRISPIRDNFCYFVVGLAEPFVVEDVAADPRTREHPSVGPMKIGAWAGWPVVAPGGEILGTFCVVDENPREWHPDELATLSTLARSVANEIHLRQSLAASQSALETATILARSLQDSLLPPRLSKVPGVDAAASYLPAAGGSTVVGDFYDLFHAHGRRWCTVMGDVCGKGVEAAKVTALARYTLRAEATQHDSPATVLERLNAALLSQRGGERFVTAVYATFSTTSSGVAGRLCLAGHPHALLRRADGRVRRVGTRGTLLGVLADVSLTDVRFRLAPGDTLLLYTDGATEARARRVPGARMPRPMFGEDRLSAVLTECRGLDAAGIIERVERAVAAHTGDWAADDTALLALRVPQESLTLPGD
ncbi:MULTISPECIES: PP2C family protein-serine/threonine phosphatase [unclassified Streptomyces]|uniref:PP2C family protein-serine/threonine phosphatase n=1 Tax=unclassified Streptomyces TaxID=2593676 RepID=UPI002E2C9110|nr:GAF domain-containing SpoIIE family protein phosphatase [Streptomyces sp. NBC_00223]